jgi:hypothetical protein
VHRIRAPPNRNDAVVDKTLTEMWWLALAIETCLGQGLMTVLLKALSPGKAGPDEIVTIYSAFIATWPLSLAVGGVLVFWSVTPPRNFGEAGGAIAIALGLGLAGLVLSGLSFDVNEALAQIQTSGGGHWLARVISFELETFFDLYGPGLYMSAF